MYHLWMNLYQLTERTTTNHIFIRLVENCESGLDNNLFTETVLINLSNVIDGLPHDFLIAYRLIFNPIFFLNWYIKEQKQDVEINNVFSVFLTILWSDTEVSI